MFPATVLYTVPIRWFLRGKGRFFARWQLAVTDIQVLFTLNIVVAFTLALCLFAVGVGRDREMLTWASAFGLHSIAYVLLAFRGVIPDLLSITLANTLVAVMLSMFTEGVYRFEQVRPPRLLIWLPALITAITFTLYIDNFRARVGIHGIVMVYQMALLMWSIARGLRTQPGRGRWIVVGAALLTTMIFMIRAGFAVSVDAGDNAMLSVTQTSPVQLVSFTTTIVALIMFALGLLLMFKERAEQFSLSLALKDPLTQLGNRRLLNNVLEQWPRKYGGDEIGTLLMMDLDNFKKLNDSCGHTVGDQYLVEVAYRIRENTKAVDTVVRLGGDEFVVLLPDLGSDCSAARERAQIVAERILAEVARPYPFLAVACQGTPLSSYECGLSIGAALFRSASCRPHENLLKHADAAMYDAKKRGRHQVVFHDSGEPL